MDNREDKEIYEIRHYKQAKKSQYIKLAVSLNFEEDVLNSKCDVMVKYFASVA
jgi:hypothetical protein